MQTAWLSYSLDTTVYRSRPTFDGCEIEQYADLLDADSAEEFAALLNARRGSRGETFDGFQIEEIETCA